MRKVLFELTRHEVEVIIRTRRFLLVAVLFTFVSALAGLGVAASYRAAESAIETELQHRTGMTPELVSQEVDSYQRELIEEVIERRGIDLDALSPALLSSPIAASTFWLSLMLFPFLILLSTYDAVSSDLRVRSLCFATLRAPRWAIVTSRALAWWLVTVAVMAIATAVVLFGSTTFVSSFSPTDAARATLRISMGLVPVAATWVGLTLLCSSSTDRSIRALIRASFLLLALRAASLPSLLSDAPAGSLQERALSALRQLNPSAYYAGLWHGLDLTLIADALVAVLFGAVGLAGAIFVINRRDL